MTEQKIHEQSFVQTINFKECETKALLEVKKTQLFHAFGDEQCRLISLAEVKDYLGDHWEQKSDKIYAIADKTIHDCLHSGDCYSRADEESYLIAFTRYNAKQADEVCDKILQKIKNYAFAIPVQQVIEFEDEEEEEENIDPNSLYALGDFKVFYLPIMSVKAHKITSSYAYLGRRDPLTEQITFGAKAYPAGAPLKQLLEIDNFLIQQVVKHVTQLRNQNKKCFVTIPCQAPCLQKHHDTYLNSILRHIPDEIRPYIMFDIIGTTPSSPSNGLSSLVNTVKPFAHAVMIQTPVDQVLLDPYFTSGGDDGTLIKSVKVPDHIDQSIYTSYSNTTARVIDINFSGRHVTTEHIERFAHRVKNAKKSSYIHGLEKPEQIDIAERNHIQFVSGLGVGKPSALPHTIEG